MSNIFAEGRYLENTITPAIHTTSYKIAFVLIIVAAFILRYLGIYEKPLSLDEGYSVWFSNSNWDYLFGEVPKFETHPVFYYSLLKLWRSVAGASEAALRLPSLIASVATLPFLYLSGRIIGGPIQGRALGIMAIALAALWDRQLYYAQEARPYALLNLAMAVATAATLWILVNREVFSTGSVASVLRRNIQARWALFGLGTGLAALLWAHNVGIVPASAIGLFLFIWWCRADCEKRNLFVFLLLAACLAVLLYAPNIYVLVAQVKATSENFWLLRPGIHVMLGTTAKIYAPMAMGGDLAVKTIAAALIGVTGLVGLIRICRVQGSFTVVVFLIFLTAVPWLATVAVTYAIKPIFMERTLLYLQIPAILTMAAMPWALASPLRAPAAIVLLILIARPAYWTVSQNLDTSTQGERAYREIVRTIATDQRAGAPVLLLPADLGLPIGYYETRLAVDLDTRPLPGPYPVRGRDYRYPAGGGGVPEVTEDALRDVLAGLGDAPVIWTVTRRADLFDPQHAIQTLMPRVFPCRKVFFGDNDKSVTLARHSRQQACDARYPSQPISLNTPVH